MPKAPWRSDWQSAPGSENVIAWQGKGKEGKQPQTVPGPAGHPGSKQHQRHQAQQGAQEANTHADQGPM